MNNKSEDCPICRSASQAGPDWAIKSYSCPRCGDYEYDSTVGWLEVKTPDHLVRLSAWVRQQNAAGITPRITPDRSRRIAASPLPRYRERSDLALDFIAKHYGILNTTTPYARVTNDLALQAVTYCANADDVRQILSILQDQQLIHDHEGAFFRLKPKGLLTADDRRFTAAASAQGFVAMRFDDALKDAWTDGFDPAIRSAGFHPLRIDAKEYVGGITDEIISEIRRSRFVVADYTDQANGVYFEAGFALGLGLTVIPTCRSDQIGKLHFDIKHLNTLAWKTPDQLAIDLARRIVAVIGAGPDIERR